MIPLDGSIPTVLLIWFQTIADAIPTRARTTVMELVFGCMLTGRGHVTQAIAAITPRRGWRAYFRMIETGSFSWLDIVHALCRIVRDSFVPQDCCVMALDDTLLLRSSKKAPGAARRFDHAGKPNPCPGAEPRLALHGHRAAGAAAEPSPGLPSVRRWP
jgi:hypothetical protein